MSSNLISTPEPFSVSFLWMSFFAKTTDKAARIKAAMPWVEKYRPKTMADVAHQDEVIATLRSSMDTANVCLETHSRD